VNVLGNIPIALALSGTTVSGIADPVYCVLASVSCIKGTTSDQTGRGINISGVDFWHAVEFSRNGRFLQDPFTGLSRRFVLLRFLAYQTVSGPAFPSSRAVSGPFRRVKP